MFTSFIKYISVVAVIFLALFGALVATPAVAHAATLSDLNPFGYKCLLFDPNGKNPQGCDANTSLISNVKSFLLALAPVVAVLAIIYGGYQYFLPNANNKETGMRYITSAIIGLVIVYLASFIQTLVQDTLGGGNTTDGKLNSQPIIDTIVNLVNNLLIPISGAAGVFFIILGAYQLLTSGGDESKAKQGQKTIMNAIIAVVIILVAIILVQLVQYFVRSFGVNA